MTEQETLVWYVAYGSNMVPERLDCYLAGGRPEGAQRRYLGARDYRPPRQSHPVRIRHRLFFAGVSKVWGGGGVAFVQSRRCAAADTPAVAYLITLEQLSDLVAQESGGEVPGVEIATVPAAGQQLSVGMGLYDLLVGVEAVEGRPAVVLTTSSTPASNAPSAAYAEMVCRGRSLWWGDEGNAWQTPN